MGKLYMLAGLLAFVAAGPALAQAPAPPHQEHQSTAQNEPTVATDARCCCEAMMHMMMMEMMQKHQGMGVAHPTEPKPQPEEHKH